MTVSSHATRAIRWAATAIILFGAAKASSTGIDRPVTPPSNRVDLSARKVLPLGRATLAAVDAAANEAVVSGDVPGLALGIVRDGRLVFVRGYGLANLETRTPVRVDTVFNIFSITKTFTAVAILQMAERGQLNVEDPLSRFLPDFPRARDVTIAQLLSHTSGIHNYTDEHPVLEKMGATPDQLVKVISEQPKLYDFEPGTRWAYSSSNYVLLGKIIELIGKQSYRNYMAEQLFTPVNLRNTAVDRNYDVVAGRASGYVRTPQFPTGFANAPYANMSVPYAAGNIRSTVPDLAKWFAALTDGRVISRASFEQLIGPVRVKDGRLAGGALFDPQSAPIGQYGLGVRSYVLDGHRAIGPSGSFYGGSAKVAVYLDDRLTIIVLTNVNDRAADLEERFARIIFADARRKPRER